MTEAPLAPAPRAAPKSQVALLVGTLLLGIAGGWSLGALVYPGQGLSSTLVQRGQEPIAYAAFNWTDVEVFYARPYAGKPNLKFEATVNIQDQRADGFKVRVQKSDVPSQLGWTAEGLPARP